MADENFSRAFEFIEADNEDSAIQELVFTAIGYLEENEQFSAMEFPRDQIECALRCFKEDDLILEKPEGRKDDREAKRLLDLIDRGHMSQTIDSERFTAILVLASPGTELIVRTFTRRATHFLALQNYELASGDFQMALDHAKNLTDYDETKFRLHHKLAQCFAKMRSFTSSVEHLKLALNFLDSSSIDEAVKFQHQKVILDSLVKMSKKKSVVPETMDAYEAMVAEVHPDLPGVSAKVKILESESQGRFAVAEKSICPGEIVTVDEPASYVLNPDDPAQMFNYCGFCLRQCLAPIPCNHCSGIVYCTKQCLLKDSEGSHKFECQMNLFQLRQTENANSFRIFLTLRAILKYSPKRLIEMNRNSRGGGKKFDEVFEAFLGMVSHQNEKEKESKLKYIVLAILIFRALKQHTDYFHKMDENNSTQALDILEVIHKIIQVQDVNTHPIFALDQSGSRNQAGLTKIGNGVYPFIGSFFNHSCNPNTCRINTGNKTALVATRTIRPGEEISDIYSMHYSETPTESRRAWLEKNFFFRCRCEACSHDWPMYDQLNGKIDSTVLGQLQQIENAIYTALKEKNYQLGLKLHAKDVELIEGKVPEPHRLFVSVRNSLQYCLWKAMG